MVVPIVPMPYHMIRSSFPRVTMALLTPPDGLLVGTVLRRLPTAIITLLKELKATQICCACKSLLPLYLLFEVLTPLCFR